LSWKCDHIYYIHWIVFLQEKFGKSKNIFYRTAGSDNSFDQRGGVQEVMNEIKLHLGCGSTENILEQGLRIYHSGLGTKSEYKQKREEASLLGESVIHETQGSLVLG